MKVIIFVCVENSNRSQMAEAFARMHGEGKCSTPSMSPSSQFLSVRSGSPVVVPVA